MRSYRFSIRGLMSVIAIIAVGLVALRMPSRIWANAWFTAALAGVTVAISAAVASAAERRAFWVGFAVNAGAYFLLALGPVLDRATHHQLLTTTILDLAAPHIINNTYILNSYTLAMQPQGAPAFPSEWQVWNLPDFQTTDNMRWNAGYVTLHSPFLYLRIGHSIFCLLLGCAGGELARYLYLKRPTSSSVRPAA